MTKTHRGRPGVAPSGATAATQTAAPVRELPSWITRGSLVLAVIGLLASAYLTYEHFSASATLACPEGEVVNCVRVTSSRWAYLFGIPVAPLGLLWFLPVVALSVPKAWRNPRLDGARIALLGLGTAFVVYLVWAELFKIGSICLWCTVVHVVTVLLLALALLAWALAPRR